MSSMGDIPFSEEVLVFCYECNLNFQIRTNNPEVIHIFAELGCVNPICPAKESILVHDKSTKKGKGGLSD